MNAKLTCTECGSIIECPSEDPPEVNGCVTCDCGARFAITVTLLGSTSQRSV